MRRTLKGYCVLSQCGFLSLAWARRNPQNIPCYAKDEWPKWKDSGYKLVPITVTYDDGRPAPRKRDGAKRRGGRRV